MHPAALAELANLDKGRDIAIRRTARYLRVRLRQQREATRPEFSDRATLINTLVTSSQVRRAMAELESQATPGETAEFGVTPR